MSFGNDNVWSAAWLPSRAAAGAAGDVAGDADHEDVAESLIVDELDRHARVGAAEQGSERLLLRSELAQASEIALRIDRLAGREARVALAQSFESFGRGRRRRTRRRLLGEQSSGT